jgi:AraC-like DNA-binding protein
MDLQHGARIVAAQRYRISTLTVRDDLFVVVLKGRKILQTADSSLSAGHQQGVLVAQGTQWDVINDPEAHAHYEALALSFSDTLIREFNASSMANAGAAVNAAQCVMVDEELLEAMQRTLPAASGKNISTPLLHHRIVEVLMLLAERGWRFEPGQALSWPEKVRRLVAQRPHGDWNVTVLADLFHLSESTLRRRLESSGTTLAALVREVRLETALSLLQTTEWPVGEVAQRCGWDSHSRFTAIFQQRWGVAPSVVRARMKENGQALTETG